MRNILEYPVTLEEKLDLLERFRLELEQFGTSIGDGVIGDPSPAIHHAILEDVRSAHSCGDAASGDIKWGCSPSRLAAVLAELLCGRIPADEASRRMGVAQCTAGGSVLQLTLVSGERYTMTVARCGERKR